MRRTLMLFCCAVAALALAGGIALAANVACKPDKTCRGTNTADKMKGSGGDDRMYGRKGPDRLYGKAGKDDLHGDQGDDYLSGGDSSQITTDDQLLGGPGDDRLDGGAGYDFYIFEGDSWGRDAIVEGDDDSGVFFTGLSADLTVNLAPAPGSREVSSASGSTVDWSRGVHDVKVGGTGDDTIVGTFADDAVRSVGGFDEMYLGSGSDEADVNDFSGGDYVDCGEDIGDNDSVIYDGPTQFSLGDTVVGCETLFPL